MVWLFETQSSKPYPIVSHGFGNYTSDYDTPQGLFLEKWIRRTLWISLYTIAFFVVLLLFPIFVLVTFIADLVTRRKGFTITRAAILLIYFLAVEMLTIYIFGLAVYIISQLTCMSTRTYQRINLTNMHHLGNLLFHNIFKILGLDTSSIKHVRSLKSIRGTAPTQSYILFMRHSSFADTFVPHYLLSDLFEMRYILKKELLKDPALDVMGSRTPNFFIARSVTGHPDEVEKELASVTQLLADYETRSNVITTIWPEGTRFTEIDQARRIKRFKEKIKEYKQEIKDLETGEDPDAEFSDLKTVKKQELKEMIKEHKSYVKNSKRLKHTLLPHISGVLALLDANDLIGDKDTDENVREEEEQEEDVEKGDAQVKHADVLFCAHVGLEGAVGMLSSVAGHLYHETLQVKFWRVAYEDVPKSRDERVKWLQRNWERMDKWIDKKLKQKKAGQDIPSQVQTEHRAPEEDPSTSNNNTSQNDEAHHHSEEKILKKKKKKHHNHKKSKRAEEESVQN